MIIYVVILTHEHGIDTSAKFKHEDALKVAGSMISETVVELENEIDGDTDGLQSLESMKGHIAAERYEEAISIYNELQNLFFTSADEHHLAIKEMEVK